MTLACRRLRECVAAATPEAIRDFCERAGVAKANSTVEYSQLEFCIRNDLNHRSPRLMGVLDPLKVVLTNLDNPTSVDADLWPHDIPKDGTRSLILGREIYIDREDFREDAPKGFFPSKTGWGSKAPAWLRDQV